MLIGYARTSTARQENGINGQRRDLEAQGCADIYQEQVSSVGERAQLQAAIRGLRAGDILVVTKLDRLARSIEHAIKLEAKIRERGGSLKVLDPAIDTSTATGRLLFGMLSAISQFEREVMLERQREGIEAARQAGRYRGRQPTALRKTPEIEALLAQGVAKAEIARQLGVSVRSVFRIARNLSHDER